MKHLPPTPVPQLSSAPHWRKIMLPVSNLLLQKLFMLIFFHTVIHGTPVCVSKLHWRGLWGQNYFFMIIRHGDAKAVVDKTTSTLTWVKTVALNYTRSHYCIFPYHVFTVKNIQISLKNVPDEVGKANNFVKSWL